MKDDVTQNYGTSLWSSSNVPSVGTTLTNPAYHYVIHATYSITPTVLNEVAYNQNGKVINIVPNGVYKRPADLSIPELFSGNNDNRIPGISLNGSANYDVSSGPVTTKPMPTSFVTMSPSSGIAPDENRRKLGTL